MWKEKKLVKVRNDDKLWMNLGVATKHDKITTHKILHTRWNYEERTEALTTNINIVKSEKKNRMEVI